MLRDASMEWMSLADPSVHSSMTIVQQLLVENMVSRLLFRVVTSAHNARCRDNRCK